MPWYTVRLIAAGQTRVDNADLFGELHDRLAADAVGVVVLGQPEGGTTGSFGAVMDVNAANAAAALQIALDHFRKARAAVGLPSFPVEEIEVTRDRA